jgi:hypothetical protein
MDKDKTKEEKSPEMIEKIARWKKWQSRSWSGWKSPVGLGFFLLTASLALAILLYTGLNFAVSITEILHPEASAGLSQQELQQELDSGAASGTTGQ